MKRIRVHSSRFITQLNVRGPIYSIINVEDSVYDSIVKSGHNVELVEDTLKRPVINKTVLECLDIKPKQSIIDIKEELEEKEVEVKEKEEVKEEKLEEEIIKSIVKTKLSSERIINRSQRNNRRRGK